MTTELAKTTAAISIAKNCVSTSAMRCAQKSRLYPRVFTLSSQELASHASLCKCNLTSDTSVQLIQQKRLLWSKSKQQWEQLSLILAFAAPVHSEAWTAASICVHHGQHFIPSKPHLTRLSFLFLFQLLKLFLEPYELRMCGYSEGWKRIEQFVTSCSTASISASPKVLSLNGHSERRRQAYNPLSPVLSNSVFFVCAWPSSSLGTPQAYLRGATSPRRLARHVKRNNTSLDATYLSDETGKSKPAFRSTWHRNIALKNTILQSLVVRVLSHHTSQMTVW